MICTADLLTYNGLQTKLHYAHFKNKEVTWVTKVTSQRHMMLIVK